TGDKAKWTLQNLQENQQYEVFATWMPGPSRTTAAKYVVKNRAIGSPDESKTITVDQRYTPGEVKQDNLFWRSLGFFTPDDTGKIVVELTGAWNNGYPAETVAQSMMLVKSWTFDQTPLGGFSQLVYEDSVAAGGDKRFVLKDKF